MRVWPRCPVVIPRSTHSFCGLARYLPVVSVDSDRGALKYSEPAPYSMQQKIIHSRAMTKINKCHRCGATSYKPLIKRDENGTMMPSGEYQCVDCKLVFTDIDVWRTEPAQEKEIQTEDLDRK